MITSIENFAKSELRGNEVYFGEKIETTISRMLEKAEVIEVDQTKIYTESKDGVLPETDIRTDKFDMALESVIKAQEAYMKKADEVKKTSENPVIE